MTRRLLFAALASVTASAIGATESPQAQRRSGFEFMSAETQTMQRDDTSNPGMLWVLDGERLWGETPAAGKACADCHGDARVSMKGVAARYPAFDETSGQPVNLVQRINLCRTRHQQIGPLGAESRELLGLTAFVGLQSRGQPIDSGSDPRLTPFVKEGHALFTQRQGQLNLSCANCHDYNWDKRLAGAAITQGQPTGYPLYRLEWQSLGSLQRRMRNCMTGARAQPYDDGAPEFTALELYLKTRARGLQVETPAVRP